MNEIKCPKCGSVFRVDEADYAAILSQVRNNEFQKEIERRMAEQENQFKARQETAVLKAEQVLKESLNAKEREMNQKETEIAQLKEKLNGIAQSKELEFKDVLKQKDDELAKLRGDLQQSDNQRQIALLEQQKKAQEELQVKNTRITELEGQVKAEKNAASLREKELQERFSVQLKQKQEQIDYYKDLKTRMSTKMVGETLEIHCNGPCAELVAAIQCNQASPRPKNQRAGKL